MCLHSKDIFTHYVLKLSGKFSRRFVCGIFGFMKLCVAAREAGDHCHIKLALRLWQRHAVLCCNAFCSLQLNAEQKESTAVHLARPWQSFGRDEFLMAFLAKNRRRNRAAKCSTVVSVFQQQQLRRGRSFTC